VLSSPASAALIEEAFQRLGGARSGGPPKAAAAPPPHPSSAPSASAAAYSPPGLITPIKDYGYMNMGSWDLLWSITAKAMLAAELLRPGQARRRALAPARRPCAPRAPVPARPPGGGGGGSRRRRC